MDKEVETPLGVVLENLTTEKAAWKLARHIFRMFTAVGVIRNDIQRITVDNDRGMALVHLRTKEVADFVVCVFRDVRHVMNFYDVRKISDHPVELKVSSQNISCCVREGKLSPHTSMKPVETTASPCQDVLPTTSDTCSCSCGDARDPTERTSTEESCPAEATSEPTHDETSTSCSTNSGVEFKILSEEVWRPNTLEASTSTSGIPVGGGQPSREDRNDIMIDVKTSTPQVSPCFCPDTVFYHKLQHVGNESRHAEFKRGGVVFDLRTFRNVVGRYMCAFLNTEGGTIYFGVSDDGKALGIKVDQKSEDQIRLTIDNAVSMIKPHVSTNAYSINFAKIMNEEGLMEQKLKVLEICIKPCIPPKNMFSFENSVLVRRDGSLRVM